MNGLPLQRLGPVSALFFTAAVPFVLNSSFDPSLGSVGPYPNAPRATATAPADWQPVDTGPFSVYLPPDWEYVPRQGRDSLVGEFVGGGVALYFDFGWYSDPLVEPGAPGYSVEYECIGGRLAKLVLPDSDTADTTGVHFADIGGPWWRPAAPVKLTIAGHELTEDAEREALAIFRTVRFLGLWQSSRGAWEEFAALPGYGLTDVSMPSADEGWTVGAFRTSSGESSAAFLRYRDGRWEPVGTEVRGLPIMTIDMVSAQEGWAVSTDSIVHYTGQEWVEVVDSGETMYFDVKMNSPRDGWIGGLGGLLRYQEGRWQIVSDEAHMIELDLLSPDDGWTIGSTVLGRIEHGAWRELQWPGEGDSSGLTIEMSSPTEGWIGGSYESTNRGMLMRYHNGSWETVETSATSPIWDIAMLSDGSGWAVTGGSDATIMEYRDGAWETLDGHFRGYLRRLDMLSEDEGWAVGFELGEGTHIARIMRYRACAPGEPGATPTTGTPDAITPTATGVTPSPSAAATTPSWPSKRVYLPILELRSTE